MRKIEDLIKKAKEIHNDKYDYSKVVYKRLIDKVIIICPEHGDFEQSMHAHLKGQGCPHCSIKNKPQCQKYDNKKFIEEARKTHGDKYDYSRVNYVGSKTLVEIICPEHGVFKCRPDNHIQGSGCPKCRYKKNGGLF